MTLFFNTAGDLSIVMNQPNLDTTADYYRFKIVSQYSKQNLINQLVTVHTANDRYSSFNITITSQMLNEHTNGMYWYELERASNSALIEKGICKIITNPGGGTGFVEFVSNVDNREADVYFRPNY